MRPSGPGPREPPPRPRDPRGSPASSTGGRGASAPALGLGPTGRFSAARPTSGRSGVEEPSPRSTRAARRRRNASRSRIRPTRVGRWRGPIQDSSPQPARFASNTVEAPPGAPSPPPGRARDAGRLSGPSSKLTDGSVSRLLRYPAWLSRAFRVARRPPGVSTRGRGSGAAGAAREAMAMKDGSGSGARGVDRSPGGVPGRSGAAAPSRTPSLRTGDPRPATASSPSREDVERRAFALFLERGGDHDRDWEDWFLAERELGEEARNRGTASGRGRLEPPRPETSNGGSRDGAEE